MIHTLEVRNEGYACLVSKRVLASVVESRDNASACMAGRQSYRHVRIQDTNGDKIAEVNVDVLFPLFM